MSRRLLLRSAALAAGLACALACAFAGGGSDLRCDHLAPGTRECALGDRRYDVHVPASYTGATPVPLLLDLHGYGMSKAVQAGWFGSGFRAKSDRTGFVYVTPQGVQNAWHAQGRCCSFQRNPPDDVAFLEGVVAAVRAAGNIDASRIYVAGFSNGGSMAFALACQRSELFAGAASVSFALSGGTTVEEIVAACTPSRPIPVIHFHGTSDAISPYDDGALDSIGARQSLAAWATIQGCDASATPEPVSGRTVCETRRNCRGGVAVSLCTVERGPHHLYRSVADPDIPDQIWAFWQSFPR